MRRIDQMNIEKSSSYFYALIIKADLVFVLRLFVRMNWSAISIGTVTSHKLQKTSPIWRVPI